MKKLLVLALVLLWTVPAFAKPKNVDVMNFNPTTDGGKYMTIHQSKTLYQWHFNAGMYTNYAYQPLEYADPTGARRRGIVDAVLSSDFQAAVGFTDWFSAGVNLPVVWFESYYDPSVRAAAVRKQNIKMKLGDARLEMKFRILDIERYHVGLAVVPFMYFPSGSSTYFLGNGMWSPGGKLVFDADIKNRVFLALNAGYRNYKRTVYDANTPNAVINDTLELGGGINVRITDSWAVLGEVYSESVISGLFKNQLQNPAEFLVGGRFTPQKTAKGLGVTVAGGRGMTTGVGSPDFRILAGVNYTKPKVVELPPPVEVEVVAEEKIVITQKVHFEFNQASIRPVSYPILDDVAHLLEINPQIKKVRVEGHTDWIGSDAYNQQLSERRAQAVRDYLIQKGIAPDRLIAVGYGEMRPIADNNTTKGRARNRRTEFTVLE
ncbi:MAG: OmpA family protein [Pseudomonadota bacterium]